MINALLLAYLLATHTAVGHPVYYNATRAFVTLRFNGVTQHTKGKWPGGCAQERQSIHNSKTFLSPFKMRYYNLTATAVWPANRYVASAVGWRTHIAT